MPLPSRFPSAKVLYDNNIKIFIFFIILFYYFTYSYMIFCILLYHFSVDSNAFRGYIYHYQP